MSQDTSVLRNELDCEPITPVLNNHVLGMMAQQFAGIIQF